MLAAGKSGRISAAMVSTSAERADGCALTTTTIPPCRYQQRERTNCDGTRAFSDTHAAAATRPWALDATQGVPRPSPWRISRAKWRTAAAAHQHQSLDRVHHLLLVHEPHPAHGRPVRDRRHKRVPCLRARDAVHKGFAAKGSEPGAVREANQSVWAGPPHAAPSLTSPAGRFGPVWPCHAMPRRATTRAAQTCSAVSRCAMRPTGRRQRPSASTAASSVGKGCASAWSSATSSRSEAS